jgi:hypothetical protein
VHIHAHAIVCYPPYESEYKTRVYQTKEQIPMLCTGIEVGPSPLSTCQCHLIIKAVYLYHDVLYTVHTRLQIGRGALPGSKNRCAPAATTQHARHGLFIAL